MNLHAYERLKDALADILRAVPWRAEQAERNRHLFARLAEDRFNLAVVGRYSRGKSTLMNAMLGLNRLPTGTEPLTSVITSVTYGSQERVVLHFLDTTLFLDIGLHQLEDYITERGNPGNRRRIAEAEIQLPAELLRRGFRFIDTPGLGSTVAGNTETTRDFLPEADAFLLVTGFDGALTDDEAAVLAMAHAAGRRVFLVLNKADLVDEPTRQHQILLLQARLHALGLPHEAPVYPVSAQAALGARLGTLPPSALAASLLPALEADIVAFLTRSRRNAFLEVMGARIAAVLDAEAGTDEPRRRLAQLRVGLSELEAAAGAAEEEPLGANPPGCTVCAAAERAVFDVLTSLQGQLRRDSSLRDELARQGGFCGPHGRRFAADAAPREVCVAMAPVLDERAARLRALADGAGAMDLSSLMPGHPGCMACRVGEGAADSGLDALANRLRTHPADAASLATLCLPHLSTLVDRLVGEAVVPALLRWQAQLLERRASDMRRFALKQDASLRDRISNEERLAACTGLAALAGTPEADRAARAPIVPGVERIRR